MKCYQSWPAAFCWRQWLAGGGCNSALDNTNVLQREFWCIRVVCYLLLENNLYPFHCIVKTFCQHILLFHFFQFLLFPFPSLSLKFSLQTNQGCYEAGSKHYWWLFCDNSYICLIPHIEKCPEWNLEKFCRDRKIKEISNYEIYFFSSLQEKCWKVITCSPWHTKGSATRGLSF